jgi:hypothetical protein
MTNSMGESGGEPPREEPSREESAEPEEHGGPPAERLREILRRQFGEVPPESPSEYGQKRDDAPEPSDPPAGEE